MKRRLPPAPSGWRWLRATERVKRGDRYFDGGRLVALTGDDVGSLAKAPLWVNDGRVYHYLRRKARA